MSYSPLRIGSALLLAGCAGSRPMPAATPSAAGPAAGPTTASPTAAQQTYPANSPRILVMGRHAVDGNAVRFGAAGVTFYLKFRGAGVDAELEEIGPDTTAHNWFTVVVDGREPVRFRTDRQTRRYTLVRDLAPGTHTLALSKATEGQNGYERLVAVHADELLAPDALPTRRIEFIGNSITAGYGLDPRPVACKQGTWYDATHAWLAYGPRTARTLNAQWMLSAISGIGMHRNWNSDAPVMRDVYRGVYMAYADSTTTWDHTRYTPDLVTVALGTNDFSDGGGPTPRPALDGDAFVADYTRFVTLLRERYPRARLLLLNSPMIDTTRQRLLTGYLDRVIRARAALGDSALSQFAFTGGPYRAGCDGHPSMREQEQMADQLTPEIRARMGW